MQSISELKLLQLGRRWVDGEYAFEDMVAWLQPYYEGDEARLVAQNTITKVWAQDVLIRRMELERGGMRTELIWQTSGDGDVCPVCAGRNGKRQGDGWQEPPPSGCVSAHGCRCTLQIQALP